jgi:hypothetical protein
MGNFLLTGIDPVKDMLQRLVLVALILGSRLFISR